MYYIHPSKCVNVSSPFKNQYDTVIAQAHSAPYVDELRKKDKSRHVPIAS